MPDGFGAGATAIDFDQDMGLGSQNYIMFMPDGSSQDTLGNWNSGVLYMTRGQRSLQLALHHRIRPNRQSPRLAAEQRRRSHTRGCSNEKRNVCS